MKGLLLGFITLLCCNRLMAQSKVYYVSPNGSDKNTGSRNSPLKTIDAAKNLVRKTKGPVMVHLRGGTYYLASMIFWYGKMISTCSRSLFFNKIYSQNNHQY